MEHGANRRANRGANREQTGSKRSKRSKRNLKRKNKIDLSNFFLNLKKMENNCEMSKSFQEKENEIKNYSAKEEIKPLTINLNETGITNEKNLLIHIANEQVYDSNAISDISDVDYLKNSKGLMCVMPLEEFPPFIDDIYIGGYCFFDEIKKKDTGGFDLKNMEDLKKEKGEDLESNVFAPSILNLKHVKDACENLFRYTCKKSKIYNTPGIYENTKDNKFMVGRVDYKNKFNGGGILRNAQIFKKKEKNEKPAVVAAIKVDVSNIPFKVIIENLRELDKTLMRMGFTIFNLDMARDLIGTLDPDALYYHYYLSLGYREEGDEAPISYFNEDEKEFYESDFEEWKQKAILLDREKVKKKSGNNCIKTIKNDGILSMAKKVYNKIVSNLEAGNVQDRIGSHRAEIAYNDSSPYLKKLFHHPLAIKHGVSRLELSIFPLTYDIEYEKILNEELDEFKNAKIFHSQSIAQHWLNLEDRIDRNALICDRTRGVMFLAHLASSLTTRVVGNFYHVERKNNETEEEYLKRWKNAKKECMSEFGFSFTPINVIEFEVKTTGQKKKK